MENSKTMTWLKSLVSAPSKWRQRSGNERLMFVEAFTLLGLARLMVLVVPFRVLARSLGSHMSESHFSVSESNIRIARMVGQAVRSAANNTPWKSVCLPQAVVGQWMLKRRNIPGTVYLGVMKNAVNTDKLAAHAWLRCGKKILTGADGHRQFTVVSTFSTGRPV